MLRVCGPRSGRGAAAQLGRLPAGLLRGPPGTRTRNLRIKSLVRRCSSAPCEPRELRLCVSVVPIVSRCFPFHHGEDTGIGLVRRLSYPMHSTSEMLRPPSRESSAFDSWKALLTEVEKAPRWDPASPSGISRPAFVEAQALGHGFCTDLHVLLALLKPPAPTAATDALAELGLSYEKVRERLEEWNLRPRHGGRAFHRPPPAICSLARQKASRSGWVRQVLARSMCSGP